MIPSLRTWYNASFTQEKYDLYTHEVKRSCQRSLPLFHLAETPVFVPAAFKAQLLRACDDLIDLIVSPDFMTNSEGYPHDLPFANDPGYSPMMVFDFVCVK